MTKSQRRWVCFVKKVGLRGGRSGDFEEVEGFLGLIGGFDWLCFVAGVGEGGKKCVLRG
jgi:hypothetical protein